MALSLFSYRRGNSFFHRIPSGFKLILLFFFSIFAFWNANNSDTQVMISFWPVFRICFTFLCGWMFFFLSGKHYSSLKQTGFVFVLGGLMTLFNGINFYPFSFDFGGLFWGICWTFRFFSITLISICVFETTSSLQIKSCFDSIDNVVSKVFPPFKKLHFSLVLSLCINFIPHIFETRNRIKLASRARGSEKKGLIRAIEIFSDEFIALFSIMITKAEITRKAILNRSNLNND